MSCTLLQRYVPEQPFVETESHSDRKVEISRPEGLGSAKFLTWTFELQRKPYDLLLTVGGTALAPVRTKQGQYQRQEQLDCDGRAL